MSRALLSAAPLVWTLSLLSACGSALPVTRVPEPAAAPAPAARVVIWLAEGSISTVGAAGMGERAVYVVVRRRHEDGRWEQRLHAIDRASRQATSRVVGADVELIRVDPLIVNSWDGQLRRWLGTRIARLSDSLEPVWRSDPMNISTPEYATGPLILVEQSQSGEYIGLDPEDGAVVFRLRGEPDGIMNYAVEGGSFIAIPTEDRAILVDRQSGEISGTAEGGLGEWEVIGDRLVVARPDRLIAYDGHGREAWSREGVFPFSPARAILSWSPDVPPARADALLVWERGRGLLAIDEAGADRWVYPLADEEAWSDAFQRGDRVFPSRSTMLDARSGEVRFQCGEGCAIARDDEQGVLVTETGPEGVALALYGYDGARRWRYAPGWVDDDGDPVAPSVALLSDVVATCGLEGPVVFLDRTDGSVLSTHPMLPRDREREGSPYCHLHARDDLVLAVTNRGASLFGPSRGDGDTIPEPVLLDPVPPPPEDGPPAERPLYRLATLVPPPEGPPEPYVRGRAAYLRAREAFEAARFQEAASGFIEAYRAFFAADAGEVKRLGLECCYNARLSVDRAGGGPAYDALLATLTDADEHCRNIVVRAPPPSRPF